MNDYIPGPIKADENPLHKRPLVGAGSVTEAVDTALNHESDTLSKARWLTALNAIDEARNHRNANDPFRECDIEALLGMKVLLDRSAKA